VNELNNETVIPFIHFYARFSSREGHEAASPGGLGIPHGQQLFQIVLLAAHQGEARSEV